MKRMAMNKLQQGGLNGNINHNVHNTNCIMQNRNIISDNKINYNNMNHMGNNNFMGNVQNTYPMTNGLNNNYQPSPSNISNFNINSNNNNNFNNNFALNYHPNQMQPMAVNQYVNQIFYNYGYNNNNNVAIPSHSVLPVQQNQAQQIPPKYNLFGKK